MAVPPGIPHVVIIGGGFGGLMAARCLAKAPVRVTMIDRRNHHLFQPLLYQVATAALNPSDIAYPIRAVLKKQRNARVLLAEATAIDKDRKVVVLDDGELGYDYLIVATGATHSYFGKPWESLAPGLKSIEDALEIRRRVFLAYEAAERDSDVAAQRAWLTFVVVGAGATGVELAGALGEIGLHTLAREFRRIDPRQVRVILVEGKDRVLPTYGEKLSIAAKRSLEQRHVEVRLGALVTEVDDGGVSVKLPDGSLERIPSRTVLWAAGVQASPLARTLGVPLDRMGRVEVGSDLTIPGHPEVFVIGDLAHARSDNGKEVPGVSQGAMQGGKYAAAIIAREARGKTAVRKPFHYWDKGSMATIGRASAVAQIGSIQRAGFLAWLLWWAVHIFYLIGFRSRVIVFFGWGWHWLTFQRGARLITGPVHALPPVRDLRADGTPALPAAAESIALPAPGYHRAAHGDDDAAEPRRSRRGVDPDPGGR
jgi:NADH dehydrogenase